MGREEQADGDPGENRVAAEQIAEIAGEVLVGADRHAVEETRKRDAPEQRGADRGDRVHPGPRRLPARGLCLLAPLERHDPYDQQHEDEEKGEVEAREHRRVPHGKCRERGAAGDDEPDLVSVPDGPDRLEHRRPVGLVPADDGQERADAEVEALEHEIARPENAEQAEPGDLERPSWLIARRRHRCSLLSFRSDLRWVDPRVSAHQPEVDAAEDRVQEREHAEAEPDCPGADGGRHGVLCLEQPPDHPGLAPGLREQPACEVREERERDPRDRGALEPLRVVRAACATAPRRPRRRGRRAASPGRP